MKAPAIKTLAIFVVSLPLMVVAWVALAVVAIAYSLIPPYGLTPRPDKVMRVDEDEWRT